jgi:hypothetical protein
MECSTLVAKLTLHPPIAAEFQTKKQPGLVATNHAGKMSQGENWHDHPP